jgi:hypothetical protein
MRRYLARWEASSNAETPEKAAREAFATARKPGMTTAAFDVLEATRDGMIERISANRPASQGKYLVRWEIDQEVETAWAASLGALGAIQEPDTIATVFDILDGRSGDLVERVDLTLLDTGVQW